MRFLLLPVALGTLFKSYFEQLELDTFYEPLKILLHNYDQDGMIYFLDEVERTARQNDVKIDLNLKLKRYGALDIEGYEAAFVNFMRELFTHQSENMKVYGLISDFLKKFDPKTDFELNVHKESVTYLIEFIEKKPTSIQLLSYAILLGKQFVAEIPFNLQSKITTNCVSILSKLPRDKDSLESVLSAFIKFYPDNNHYNRLILQSMMDYIQSCRKDKMKFALSVKLNNVFRIVTMQSFFGMQEYPLVVSEMFVSLYKPIADHYVEQLKENILQQNPSSNDYLVKYFDLVSRLIKTNTDKSIVEELFVLPSGVLTPFMSLSFTSNLVDFFFNEFAVLKYESQIEWHAATSNGKVLDYARMLMESSDHRFQISALDVLRVAAGKDIEFDKSSLGQAKIGEILRKALNEFGVKPLSFVSNHAKSIAKSETPVDIVKIISRYIEQGWPKDSLLPLFTLLKAKNQGVEIFLQFLDYFDDAQSLYLTALEDKGRALLAKAKLDVFFADDYQVAVQNQILSSSSGDQLLKANFMFDQLTLLNGKKVEKVQLRNQNDLVDAYRILLATFPGRN